MLAASITVTLTVNALSCLPGLAPRQGLLTRPVTALAPVHSLLEVDYLTVEHEKIYVGWSRHWVLAWLWFLS